MQKASRVAAGIAIVLALAVWAFAQDPQSAATLQQMQETLRRLEAEVASLRATLARLTSGGGSAVASVAPAEPASPAPATRVSAFQRSRAAYAEGMRLEDQKLYRAAIESFSLAIQLDPRNDSAWLHRGSCFYQLGDYPSAEADFTRSLSVQPDNSRAYLARAAAHAALGDHALAMSDVTEAIRRDARNPDAYLLRGRLYQQQGESDKSVADYSTVLALAPNSEKAYLGRAAVLLRDGFADRAMADCDNAVRLNANSFAAYLCRAQSYIQLGTPERAIDEINHASLTAQTLDPSSAVLAEAWQAVHAPAPRDAAPGSPKPAAEPDRTAPEPAVQIATAASVVQTAAAGFAANPPALQPVAEMTEAKRPAQAQPSPQPPAASGNAASFEKAGRSSSQSAMLDDALKALNRALEIDPKRASAYNARGYVLLLMRRYDRAAEDFSEAIRLNPAYANAYHNRAVARRRAGDPKGAADDDRAAASIASAQKPASPPVNVTARR